MGYRKNQINSPNYFKFGETVTHQLFGTSSSITPYAHQETEFLSVPKKEKKQGHCHLPFIMVKKISFDLTKISPHKY